MNRNDLSLADFRAVVSLAELGSFRRAADVLGLSASALSRQISGLEERLDTRLFDRDTRNVSPTAQGLVLAGIAQRALHAADDGMGEFRTFLSAGSGRLTIAGLPSVTAGFLPGVLKIFAARHPNIDLRIYDALSAQVLDAVESGAADLGFAAGTATARERLHFQQIMDDRFVAISRSDGPLRDQRTYDWAEIVDMPFIAMAPGTSVRELIDGACLRIGASLAPRFEVAHLATAGALVAEGLGITALPTLTLPILNMGDLVHREIENFGATRRIGLVRRPGRSLSPSAAAFYRIVMAGDPVG